MKFKKGLSLVIVLFSISVVFANYKISGKINFNEDWQPQIFLASVEKIDDYYSAFPDLIIDATDILEDGSFVLTGNNLPKEKKFYRLYLIKSNNTEFDACLYVDGGDHNFIHLVLDNNSHVEISVDSTLSPPFAGYQIAGDLDNKMMASLSKIVFPSFYFSQIKFPGELRLSKEKLNNDLITFSDTCQHIMPSLAAVINTDFDNFYIANQGFYNSFKDRLELALPNNSYLSDYKKKLEYHNPNEPTNIDIKNILILLFFGMSVILGMKVVKLKNLVFQLEQLNQSKVKKLDGLTQKEKEIFKLIKAQKSNKEIASMLFIELSTVKTHINNLYAKMGFKNRKEAANFTGEID